MMGDAGSMQQFVGNTGKDVTNLKRRLNFLESQHEKLVEASDTRMLKTEKILIETEKRSVQNKQGVVALKLDVAGYKMLKKYQYNVLVKDIDTLLDLKAEFNKKQDFLNKKVD